MTTESRLGLVVAPNRRRAGGRDQSAFAPANLTTLPHFPVSSARNLPKSPGESASGAPPRSASRALILSSARPALVSLLSLSTISAGVFFAAPRPNQVLASKPGTKSPTVGRSGRAIERVADVTASARNFPVLTYSTDADEVPK